MRKVKIAVIQIRCCEDRNRNIEKAKIEVKKAAEMGADIILLPELFENLYFCQQRRYDYYDLAESVEESLAVNEFKAVAKELGVVIPVSFYERDNNVFYNSAAVIDADGSVLGVYRKTHIPDDHFYQEKFYFTPGDTGFKVWDTRFGKIGVGICWDQWFPEAARCFALNGAEILFYPTAIGSEPILGCDSMPHWRRCIKGHSAANIIPTAVANRIGREEVFPCEENGGQSSALIFYGSSFITDETGETVKSASRDKEEILISEIDLDAVNDIRRRWGIFRDRRPRCYKEIAGDK